MKPRTKVVIEAIIVVAIILAVSIVPAIEVMNAVETAVRTATPGTEIPAGGERLMNYTGPWSGYNTSYGTVPQPVSQEIPVFSKALIRTVGNESVTDRFDLPGNGTYRILVRTYQPETEVTVAVEYQELISTDKFGEKTYGGFGEPGGYCAGDGKCFPHALIPGATSVHGIGTADRFHDLNTTIAVPGVGINVGAIAECNSVRYSTVIGTMCSVQVAPIDIINPRLDIITTKAARGRITVELWKVE